MRSKPQASLPQCSTLTDFRSRMFMSNLLGCLIRLMFFALSSYALYELNAKNSISCLITGANLIGESLTHINHRSPIYLINEIKNRILGELVKQLRKNKSESFVRLRCKSESGYQAIWVKVRAIASVSSLLSERMSHYGLPRERRSVRVCWVQ
jgi:hypothetical protein